MPNGILGPTGILNGNGRIFRTPSIGEKLLTEEEQGLVFGPAVGTGSGTGIIDVVDSVLDRIPQAVNVFVKVREAFTSSGKQSQPVVFRPGQPAINIFGQPMQRGGFVPGFAAQIPGFGSGRTTFSRRGSGFMGFGSNTGLLLMAGVAVIIIFAFRR